MYILHIGNFVLISELFTFFLVLFCLNQLKSVLYHNHDLKKNNVCAVSDIYPTNIKHVKDYAISDITRTYASVL